MGDRQGGWVGLWKGGKERCTAYHHVLLLLPTWMVWMDEGGKGCASVPVGTSGCMQRFGFQEEIIYLLAHSQWGKVFCFVIGEVV